jgi:type 1 glutamine amidotransferase
LALSTAAAPIRVGIFVGTAPDRYWHTANHTASNAIASILADPAAAKLGAGLAIPAQGFSFDQFGVKNALQCNGYGCGPTAEQKAAFIRAFDTIDVMIYINTTEIGKQFISTPDRDRILTFSRTRGLVSIHYTSESVGSWPAWDSLHGAIFDNHPTSDRQAKVRLDSTQGFHADDTWWALNNGLNDTTFLEEWLSFTTNGDVIRSVPGLKVLLNMDESTYLGGLSGARAMGDHPISWYRMLPEGGRFFYTAIGHRANLYQGGSQPRFLRRQIYNAIVWAAGYNADGTSVRAPLRSGRFADHAHLSLSGGTLTVSLLHTGAHTVEINSLDGRRVTSRRGSGRASYVLEELRRGTVYIVAVTTPTGRLTRLATVP